MGCGPCWRFESISIRVAKSNLEILLSNLQCLQKNLSHRYSNESRSVIKNLIRTHWNRCIKMELAAKQMMMLLDESILNEQLLDATKSTLEVLKANSIQINREQLYSVIDDLKDYEESLEDTFSRFDALSETDVTDELEQLLQSQNDSVLVLPSTPAYSIHSGEAPTENRLLG